MNLKNWVWYNPSHSRTKEEKKIFFAKIKNTGIELVLDLINCIQNELSNKVICAND